MENIHQKDIFKKCLIFAGGIAVGITASYLAGKCRNAGNQTADFENEIGNHLTNNGKSDKDNLEVLMKEQLVRNYQFFGDEGQEKIRKSFVLVVGCGGVGR